MGANHRSPGFAELPAWLSTLAHIKRRRQADHELRLSPELDREILIGPDEAPKPEISQIPRINQVTRRPPTGARRFLCDSADCLIVTYRREFGLPRNRPDASLLLRARWIAQTRWRFGATNKRRNPVYRLIKNKDILQLLDDAAPILVLKGAEEFTFCDHLRHLHEHAGDIPPTLDKFGRCAHCARRGWFKSNA